MKRYLVIFLIIVTNVRCGSGNLFDCETGVAEDQCQESSIPQQAKEMLNEQPPRTDEAIALLEEYIVDNPEDYSVIPLLAAAYALKAGFDVFNVASAKFAGGGSFLDTMGAFLPKPEEMTSEAYQLSVTTMDTSVDKLLTMPADHRKSSSEYSYGASAEFQLTLYQSGYSVMYLKIFARPKNIGDESIDPEQLRNMSDEDAAEILNSLRAARDNGGSGQGEEVSGKINEALAEIDSTEGGSDREKLIAYIEAEDAAANAGGE